MSRRERLKALDLDRILILDRGNVELALPRGWTVAPDPQGHLACKDSTDSCKLEVSYFALPPLPPGGPSMTDRVRSALEGVAAHQEGQRPPIGAKVGVSGLHHGRA